MLKTFLSCALAFGVTAGCGQTGDSEKSLQDRALSIIAGSSNRAVLQDVKLIQMAQGNGPQLKIGIEDLGLVSLAFLDTDRNGIETWIVGGGFSIALQDGFIRNTRGFGDDQMATDIAQTRAAVLGQREGQATRIIANIGPEETLVQNRFDCTITKRGARTLKINGKGVPTTLMAEDCTGQSNSFTNLYWIRNATGKVVQSRQWGSARIGPIVLRDN